MYKTVGFPWVGQKNYRLSVFFLRFWSFPTVQSILRLDSHGYNAYSLLYTQMGHTKKIFLEKEKKRKNPENPITIGRLVIL
jgi:hypothetical protein